MHAAVEVPEHAAHAVMVGRIVGALVAELRLRYAVVEDIDRLRKAAGSAGP